MVESVVKLEQYCQNSPFARVYLGVARAQRVAQVNPSFVSYMAAKKLLNRYKAAMRAGKGANTINKIVVACEQFVRVNNIA